MGVRHRAMRGVVRPVYVARLLVAVLLLAVAHAEEEEEKDEPGPSEPDSREYFDQLDKLEPKGSLSQKELTPEFLKAVQWGEEEGGPSAAMAKMDANKDQQASLEEYLTFTSPLVEAYHAKADFDGADADHDGVLTLVEYDMAGHSQMLKPEGKTSEQHKAALYKSLDSDGD